MRSMPAPCGDTPLLWKEGGLSVSLVDPPGPCSWVGEAGKERLCTATSHRCSLSQPLILYSHCCPRRGCSPTEAQEAELGEELERRSWLGAFNSPPVLSLALRANVSHCVTIPFQPRKLRLRRRCLRGWNSDHAFLDAQGGYWDEREFGGGQGSGTLPNFPRLLKEVAGSETKALPPLWCRVNFSVRDRVEGREFGTLRNKEQQRPLGARDGTQFAGSEGVR